MLLAHPWLASLSKPETIDEDAEAEDAAENDLADATGALSLNHPSGRVAEGDYTVAEWVRGVLAGKKQADGVDGVDGEARKPALHAAPLVSPLGSPLIGA